MSATIAECRIFNCNNRRTDGSCKKTTVNINSLKMCSKVNTKEPHKKASENIENLTNNRELNP